MDRLSRTQIISKVISSLKGLKIKVWQLIKSSDDIRYGHNKMFNEYISICIVLMQILIEILHGSAGDFFDLSIARKLKQCEVRIKRRPN